MREIFIFMIRGMPTRNTEGETPTIEVVEGDRRILNTAILTKTLGLV
jgi:hypothetical protein